MSTHDGDGGVWSLVASSMFGGALRYVTSDGAGIDIPGHVGPYGRSVDRLEGFARVGLLAAFLHRSTIPISADGPLEFLARGISAGVDPKHPCWPRTGPRARSQVLVEAASVALALRVAGAQLWSSLSPTTRRALIEWFQGALLIPVPDNNWHLFRMMLAGALEEYGHAIVGAREVRDSALSRLDSWLQPRSWYSDGPGRSYDYYNSFALHYYPTFDAYLAGRESLDKYVARLEDFAGSFADWFSDSGSPVMFGRSLTYRFGVVASLSLCAVVTKDQGLADRAGSIATACIRYFWDSGVLETGTLTLGWLEPDKSILQGYSGPASPYWATKAFVALLTPRVSSWEAQELSIDRPVPAASLGAPGVLAHRPSREIVTLYNHGSVDRSLRADPFRLESPLYSRIGYSSVAPPAVAVQGYVPMGVAISDARKLGVRGGVIVSSEGDGWAGSTATMRVGRADATEPGRIIGHRYMRRVWSFVPACLRPVRQMTRARVASASVVVGEWVVHAIDVRDSPISGVLRFTGWPVEALGASTREFDREVSIGGTKSASDLSLLGSGRTAVVLVRQQLLPVAQTEIARRGDARLLVTTRLGAPGSEAGEPPVAHETADGFELANGSSYRWHAVEGGWTQTLGDRGLFGILPGKTIDTREDEVHSDDR